MPLKLFSTKIIPHWNCQIFHLWPTFTKKNHPSVFSSFCTFFVKKRKEERIAGNTAKQNACGGLSLNLKDKTKVRQLQVLRNSLTRPMKDSRKADARIRQQEWSLANARPQDWCKTEAKANHKQERCKTTISLKPEGNNTVTQQQNRNKNATCLKLEWKNTRVRLQQD